MIEDAQRYGFITSQIQYHNEKMIEAFNRYVQLFSAIVGGSIWLSLQKHPVGPTHYGLLAGALVSLLTLLTVSTIVNDLDAWFGFREAETALVGPSKLVAPHRLRSCWMQYLMLLGILAACAGFWMFNPLAEQ